MVGLILLSHVLVIISSILFILPVLCALVPLDHIHLQQEHTHVKGEATQPLRLSRLPPVVAYNLPFVLISYPQLITTTTSSFREDDGCLAHCLYV